MGYDHPESFGSWTVTASYGYSNFDMLRGFLAEDPVVPTTAGHAFQQEIAQDELYVDGHVNFTNVKHFEIVAGIDSCTAGAARTAAISTTTSRPTARTRPPAAAFPARRTSAFRTGDRSAACTATRPGPPLALARRCRPPRELHDGTARHVRPRLRKRRRRHGQRQPGQDEAVRERRRRLHGLEEGQQQRPGVRRLPRHL